MAQSEEELRARARLRAHLDAVFDAPPPEPDGPQEVPGPARQHGSGPAGRDEDLRDEQLRREVPPHH